MGTEGIRFNVTAVWLTLHEALLGTLWDDDDLDHVVYRKNHEAMGAALALRAVHRMEWKGVEAEDGVLATIKAAAEVHGKYFTADDLKQMASRFLVHYGDIVEPMDDYLQDNGDQVRWHWLNQHGQQQIEAAVRKPTEIWITDVNVSNDVWVFARP